MVDDALTAIGSDLEGIDVERVVDMGGPAPMLLAHTSNDDIIVVGSRGRGGFKGLLLGSVGQQVVDRPCDRARGVRGDPVHPNRVTNSAVAQEPRWDSPRTRQLAVVACFDCHSDETETAWFEDIAPLSWWINNHVKEGRDELNFFEWGSQHQEADDAAETVREGSMPPDYYTWLGMHGDAKLSAAERREPATGLERTLGDG